MNYYWFDTDCFSDLIFDRFPLDIKNMIFKEDELGKGQIVISPFVFYEIIKGENKLIEIKEMYDNLIRLPAFYIANFHNIFGVSAKFIDGKEYIKQMKMGLVLGESPVEYAWYRDGYKKQLGIPYSNYIIQYCKMAAILYLVAKRCDEKGIVNERTLKQIKRIERFDQIGSNKKNIEEMFSEFFIHYNYKTIKENAIGGNRLMLEQMIVFVNLFINASEAALQLIEENIPYSNEAFNDRLLKVNDNYRVTLDDYHNILDCVSKKTNGILSVKTIFNKFIEPRIDDLFFKMVCEMFVCKRVFYKNLNNDFIDAINIYCSGIFAPANVNHFNTYDHHWKPFLEEHQKEDLFNGNQLFYHCLKPLKKNQ